MIVIPQLFNYRLIIGSLVLAILGLGFYSISHHNTLREQQGILERESTLIQHELSEMLEMYEAVSTDYSKLNTRFKHIELELQEALDSLSLVSANASLMSKYKSQLTTLKRHNGKLATLVDSYENENDRFKIALERKDQQLNMLESLSLELQESLDEVSLLKLEDVKVKTLATPNTKDLIETKEASMVDHVEVCLVLKKNRVTSEGSKQIYVQILAPNNTVVAGRGLVEHGGKTILYSGKTAVNTLGQQMNVCTKINVNNQTVLTPGNYEIKVFQDTKLLGETQVYLN
ncbi:MAG: hypothetical protein GYB39_02865 [Algicola sp.]|nr:hypothetical protein [Algicola sp.]